jgi:protease prsW family protein
VACPTCSSDNPEVASYCYRCGTSLRVGDAKRTTAYAVQSAEGVTQFAVFSTVMPHTSRHSADNYRWAIILSGVLILAATALGLLPIAIAAAAFLVPLAYLVYIDDVNLWEEAPTPVVVGLFVATGALSVLVSMFFFQWVFDDQWASFVGGTRSRGGISTMSFGALLIFAVLLPVVAEVVKNLFAVLLAARPQFDDMIDGLTFGVAAGTSYAAFETCVVYSSVFTAQDFRTTSGIATWLVVVANVMVVKSLIYGTATGIAVASFSGKGEGYDGFTPAYFANFGLAVTANVAYWVGVRLMAYLPYGNALGLVWGFVILVALVVKIRMMLQVALLEAAVEAAAVGDGSEDRRSTFVETFCPECENMLLNNASFCIVCGTSVRSSSRQARRAMGMPAVPVGVGAAPPGTPALPPAPEDASPEAPSDAPEGDGGAST